MYINLYMCVFIYTYIYIYHLNINKYYINQYLNKYQLIL